MGNEHQIHVVACSVAALGNRLNRNVVLREDVGGRCKNAAAVGHDEADVVLRLQIFDGEDGQLVGAGAANDRLDAHLQMARHLKHIAHNRAGSRAGTGAFAEEHAFACRITHRVDGVEHAVNRGELMAFGNHRGVHTHIDARIGTVGVGQKLHGVAHFVGHSQIDRRDAANALCIYLAHGYARVEGDGRKDGDLRSGIETIDVSRRIGLGVTLGLSFPQHVFVAHAVFIHAREHVVGGAVHDAHDGIDAIGDKGMLQRHNDGDSAANAGLERDLHVLFGSQAHDLFAIGSHKRLVGGNHALAVL